MNKTKIEWCDYTWNPITGCLHGCPYCYARKISMRFVGHFKPTFHPERLSEPSKLKKPSRIFVCSMGEMFGYWVKDEWIEAILKVIEDNPQHIFIVLTKKPSNAIGRKLPENLWLGTSIESDKTGSWRIDYIKKCSATIKFVSFEPLLGKVTLNMKGLDWIIIGGQTNPDFIPRREWIDNIIKEARKLNIPVFLKDNLHYPEIIREFPRKIQETDAG